MKHLFAAAAEVFAEAIREVEFFEGREVKIIPQDGGDQFVVFHHNGCEIKIIVDEFWMFPKEVCYFVNVSHPNGNFMCQTGTPNALSASINVGKAIQFANTSGDPIQSEDF